MYEIETQKAYFTQLDNITNVSNVNIEINESKLFSSSNDSVNNGMFYIVHLSGDFRAKAITVNTDVQEKQTSHSCKFPHTLKGL